MLFMEYKRHLDARDFKAYASLFTDDAVWVGNLGKAVGPAEIEALLVRTLEVYDSDLERTYHLVHEPGHQRRPAIRQRPRATGGSSRAARTTSRSSRCSAATPTSSPHSRLGGSSVGASRTATSPYISLEGII